MSGIDSNVVLLLHMNGTDLSTTFTDSSAFGTPKTITANGDAKIKTAAYKFGGASAYFDGTGDYLSTPDHDDFYFTGDFTIDFWVNFDALTGNGGTYSDYVMLCSILQLGTASPLPAFSLRWRPSSSKFEFGTYNGGYQETTTPVQSLSTGTWYHIAMVRYSTTVKFYLDGVYQAQVTGVNGVTNGTCKFTIGADNNGEGRFKGYIDEFRVSRKARWLADFTPPTAEYSYESIPDMQISGMSLDAEFTYALLQVADISLQSEIGIPLLQIADVDLDVEIDIPVTATIETHTAIIEILNFVSIETAEAGSDDTTLNLTGHGLVTGDFIVNTTIRDAEGMGSAERGCRKVVKVSDNILTYYYDLPGQAESDEVFLFSWLDITPYLIDKSLNINLKASYNNSASYKLFLPIDENDIITPLPQAGQYCRIKLDDEIRFLGVIAENPLRDINEIHPYVYMDVSCISLKGLAGRRTISINYPSDTTTDEIVTEMANTYLCAEGVQPPMVDYITEGHEIGKEWSSDVITIADVLDECSAKEGYQWFIDNEWNLNFVQDITPEDAPDLDENSRYRNLTAKQTIDSYINKVFVVGGKDNYGDLANTVNLSLSQMDALQAICAGTGVYGHVLRDSSLTTAVAHALEAGTSGKTVKYTAHNLVVGTYIYNATLAESCWIVTVDDVDTFTVNSTASDQTQGDTIVTYPLNDLAGLNIIKRLGFRPQMVEYDIDQINVNPQNRQYINLPRVNVIDSYFNIDSVTIKSVGAGYYESHIVAKLTDNSNFSTQHHPTYSDYMRGF